MHGTGRAWFLFLANIIFINYILYYMKSMIKIAKSILPLLGLLLSLSLSAQDIAVKGHVKDHTGEPLIGANILIKGTSVGTISDVDGNFTLKAAVNDILSITCIGFKGQELTVTGSNTPLVITLQEDTEMLDEVVVIGYGQVKKGDVTGSLLTVKPDELNKGKQLTAEDALVGKVAGVNIVPGSGAPGSGGTIRIRMGASLSADNDPLIVIDGVPVSNASISSINPNDIASFTVLKDASATAIYGSRASNGVIIITTKKGNTDGVSRPSFSYSANVTVGNVYKKLDVLSASEYREAFAKYANAPEAFKLGDVNTDWQDEIYRVAMGTDHNLSMTGALKNMPYRVSVGYTNQNGTLKNNNYQRLNASIGLSPKFFDKHLSVDINIKGSIEDEKPVSTSVIGSAVGFDPTRPVYQNYDGNVGLGYYMWMGVSNTPITLAASNPVSDLELADKQNKTKRSIGNIALDYKIHGFEDFRLNLNMGYDFLTEDKHDNMPDLAPAMYTGNEQDGTGKRYTYHNDKRNTLLDFYANYAKDFNDHNLNAMAGYGWQRFWYKNHDTTTDTKGEDLTSPKHEEAELYLLSFYGRLNYSWKQRYMLTATLRADASSRFSPETRWGYFPSVAAAWRVNDEAFLADNKVVSDLKLRLSYGALGNQNIGLYRYIPTLSYNTHALNYPFDGRETSMGYAITAFPSSDIKWETTVYKNIGVDISLWNNKLELSAEAYIKNTRDMLSSRNISLATGYNSSILVNDGKLRTTGFEMQAIYHGKAGGLKYDLDLNLSHYKSVLKSMANPDYLYEYGALRTYVGGEIGEFWVYQTAGIFQNQAEVDEWNTAHGYKDQNGNWQPLQPVAKPGDIRFIDQNGDGMLDTNDRVKVGSGTPKVSLGFNINLAYKDFDLVANFYGDFGAKRYNYTKYQLERMDHVFNYGKNALNAWTPENPDTDIPRAVSGDPNKNSRTSTRFVENGDYLRLNNLQIGYNLPVKYCKKMGLSNLRIYVGATRLFTITNYKGYDPSTGSSVGQMGYDYAAIPLSRDFMMGLKFGF